MAGRQRLLGGETPPLRKRENRVPMMIKDVFQRAESLEEELEHKKGMLSSYDLPFSFYKVGLDR
ncbi:MAG: hypothetical protein OXT74_19345 [Candidatus Poribacteria bacterium]|nr:hypothetical protein [Candidatus Poribacteria bacterium]